MFMRNLHLVTTIIITLAAACGQTTTPTDGSSGTDTGDGGKTDVANADSGGDSAQGDASAECVMFKAEYDSLLAARACAQTSDCQVVMGHCGSGLGNCYHPTNKSVDQADLNMIASEYDTAGCDPGGAACKCDAVVPTPSCENKLCILAL